MNRIPNPNALQEKFYWCSVTPTFYEIKPFDEHVEGLSRCGAGICVWNYRFNHADQRVHFGRVFRGVVTGFDL